MVKDMTVFSLFVVLTLANVASEVLVFVISGVGQTIVEIFTWIFS